MSDFLFTAKSIETYVKSLSVFIKQVRFVKAGNGSFTFTVKVFWLYKILFSKKLDKKINKELKERVPVSLIFDFKIIS